MAKQKQESTKSILIEIRSILKWFFSVDGAIVTLVILIIGGFGAYVIQDTIQRQRYLELLELELRNNQIAANIEVETFNKNGVIQYHVPYSSDVYKAGLQSGYLLTIDPTTQGELYTFYNIYLPKINQIDSHLTNTIADYSQKWEDCIINNLLINNKNACENETKLKDQVEKSYSGIMKNDAIGMWQTINKIQFNPTEQRLHSPLLKLFMGDKRLKVQE